MAGRRARENLTDVLGLGAILLTLLDLLPPSLLLLPTITAGGDTPCHYPTFVWFKEQLLPHLRLHGWYPGAYLGHPLLLYYFPLPFVLMAAVAPLVGMPVAFKLGTVLGVFLLPLAAYACLRLMRLPFPAPLLGAAAALVFLYVEDNPIWGGTLASTLTGEFSYTYGIGLAVLFLGLVVRSWEDGRGPSRPAAVLGATAYAHGYAVLWAGLSASCLLVGSRRPWRTLVWLLAVAVLAFALAAPLLLPLLAAWGWTTPYDDAWIDVTTRGLLPPLLWPLFLPAAVGLAWAVGRLLFGEVDRPLLMLGYAALSGAALAAAGPALGVIDVRFCPFAQLALALAGAAVLGRALSRLALKHVAAFGLVLLAVVWGDARSHVLRSWVDWNYSGLEAKELWPAWRSLTARLSGTVADSRVAVEYGPVHERAGSIRIYETLPFFSGRSTLEGVYNQASTTTHAVYYLASELFASSPNPFRSRSYSSFDPQSALSRLWLFNVGEIVAVSPKLVSFLGARPDAVREAEIPPYTLFRLDRPAAYVEPLAFAPVRAPLAGWRDTAYRWFSRKPANRALLVFTDDPRFDLVLKDPWAPPPERPLPGGVVVESKLEPERIRITTSRPGHPLLVKVSYHPRWRAEGALGPYLVSPGLMLVIPQRREATLTYTARDASDWLGLLLAAGAFARMGRAALARRRGRAAPVAAGPPPSGGVARLWLGAVPVLVLVALASLRLCPAPSHATQASLLYEKASRAYAGERWDEAAEYARDAAALAPPGDSRREELLCVQGEALLHAGHAREAVEAFRTVIEAGAGPHLAQALFSGARARAAAGDESGAREWRHRLRAEYPETPWAGRLDRERP
jgi:hypothetical protein